MSKSATKRPFAPLTAGLLARKGEAVPAGAHFSVEGSMPSRSVARSERRPSPAAKTSAPASSAKPAATGANGKTAKASAVPGCSSSCTPMTVVKRPRGAGQRAAMTLRLDEVRHFCLKIAAARTRRTSQDILMSALDFYLAALSKDELAGCNCLKELLKGQRTEI